MIDPWLRGSTYMDQAWHAWVYPGRVESLPAPQHILFTHFHPDHFHPESFPLLDKDADVLVPTTAGSYLCNKAREEGFSKTREISADQPERLNEFEIHSVRIHDHWEFLDETAYLVVEGDTAALFLADLWYIPPALLARCADRYRLAFASIPWGGSIENLCELPEGYRLDSIEDYYSYGTDESTLARRNAVMEHGGVVAAASVVNADCMIPGSFGFGWIDPAHEFVRPLPVNHGLDQEAFIATYPDARTKSKFKSMYPGDCYDSERNEMRRGGVKEPNHRVTAEMRARALSRRDSSIRLDPDGICASASSRIDAALARLHSGSVFYRDRISLLLSAKYQFEIHVVNDARQMFLFEHNRDRITLRAIDRPTGTREIVYMPPRVLSSMVKEWGPKWTDANFSMLVKVSASGWSPYGLMPIFFG